MIGKSDGAVDAVLARVDQDMDQARDRLFDLLRIPSISTQPLHEPDVHRAAEWLRDQLAGLGLRSLIKPTAGHPVVLGHYPGPAGTKAPRILFYGHYDVQPPDPLELWHSPPFEPQIVEGPHGPRLVARGAVDDKGQLMMFVEALRAWKEVGGGIPAPVTCCWRARRKSAAPISSHFSLPIRIARSRFRADQRHQYVEHRHARRHHAAARHVQLRDHSEGSGARPAFRPVRWFRAQSGQCAHADPGRYARRKGPHSAPGFYDAVQADLSGAVAEWQALGFDEKAFLSGIGLSAASGEHGLSGLQRIWGRPTADINGIWGGYTGSGSKTIIPAEASAKVSFRLVPDQDAQAIFEAFQRFVADRLPPGAQVSYQAFGMSPGMEIATDTPWVKAARAALEREYGRPAVMIGSGGSIPVVEQIKRTLDIDTLMMGFGLDDDQIHSPNEKFEMRCFHKGARSHAILLGKLAEH